MAASRGRCEPSQGDKLVQETTDPISDKASGQQVRARERVQGLVHFTRQVLGTCPTGCYQNHSSLLQSACCVLGSILCSICFKTTQQPCEEGMEGCKEGNEI